ncbi:arginine--tRNA ligase [Rhodothalassium salexigens]|uniref:arginine--tRNA ligase n=1 Tax=Rhodothalassium salexigens TaxID=1086 RepID=UPI001911CD3C|nr:arginine--tRNA ligase [Rhodothalassium salexigens]MBK5920435.1 arginine--tRNA ligase [Rhodothalassium salexigens]
MNVFASLHADLCDRIAALVDAGRLPAGLATDAVTMEPPRDPSHGDMATNAAMALAKPAGMKPRDLAEILAPELAALDAVDSVAIAGPGFINITLTPAFWRARLDDMLGEGVGYGASAIGAGEKVNVEYVSANPTGPMHVGHCRGAVVGDALANLLDKAGYSVTREYYINDAGAQIDVLARSAYLRYCEARGRDIGAIPEGLYPGDYLVPVGQKLAEIHGDAWLDQDETVWLEPVRRVATEAMMEMIRADLAALGVEHEVFFSERDLHASGRVDRTIEWLKGEGLVYEGVLEPPKGKKPEDWEPRPQLLFKASDFGDDTDRPLKKSDGSATYFAADIAYHDDKFQRGFSHMVLVLGADHGGYAKRMEAAVKAVSGGRARLSIQFCQLVKLMRHGEPVKMSKRAGQFVTLREVVDEVGRDVVRFIMLTRKNDAPLDFDFAKALEQSRDNPVWYVQYAHARAHSAFARAAERHPDLDLSDAALRALDPAGLVEADELALVQRLAQWPRVVEQAARAHEPHRVAFYLYELAGDFHTLWNRGNDDPGRRFVLDDDAGLTAARLKLVRSVQTVIASGLAVLGVEPVDELT